MQVSDVKKMKEFKSENQKLERLVADQAIDIRALNDLVKKHLLISILKTLGFLKEELANYHS